MSDYSSRIPGWIWITTPTLAIAFVGFLFYLSTLPSGNELDAVKGDAKTALEQGIERAREEAARQAGAEDVYEFYKLLEQQKVEVPEVKEYKSTPKDAELSYEYLLQAGSFQAPEDAEAMRANLLLLGLTTYQKSADIKGKQWYRVFVGPFDNRSKMNKAHDILVANNISPILSKKPVIKKADASQAQ